MAKNQSQAVSQGKKISTYLTFIVLVVMVLALIAIFIAFDTFLLGDQITAGVLAAIGLIAMSMSLFLLFQSRKQAAAVKIEVPKVMSTLECQSKGCSDKIVREFQRGDYVFKVLDSVCAKCGAKQMVTAIYKEVKEKEKTYNV